MFSIALRVFGDHGVVWSMRDLRRYSSFKDAHDDCEIVSNSISWQDYWSDLHRTATVLHVSLGVSYQLWG